MKILSCHKVLLLVFIIIFPTILNAADQILPLPKPKVEEETKSITAKKKNIYPKEKPNLKKKTKIAETNNETLNEEIVSIYPKKKPLEYKKKITPSLKKSSILSKKDFKIAKEALNAVDNRKWQTALKISKKSKDKKIHNLINWLYLKETTNGASFYDYLTFINNNPNYPRINRLRYLAEHKINLNKTSPIVVYKWFNGKEPLSGFGKIKLGEIYISQGNVEKGSALIKEGWVKARLSKGNIKYLRKKYKKFISSEDHVKRADWLAWEGKHWDLKRMLRYLPKDYQLLYTARQILISKSYGVDNAIKNVPAKFKNNIGLQYDRLKWRRKRGRLESSLEILLKIPKANDKVTRPDLWAKERIILSRSLIYKKNYPLAYRVASNHSIVAGSEDGVVEYAEAEWFSGWVALRFLNDPNMALQHFKNFYNNVGYPISLSRGSYWIGQTYKALNNNQKSKEWFLESSKYLTTYYGQLSFREIYPNKPFSLDEDLIVAEKYSKQFNKNKLIKTVRILHELNKTKYSKDIIKHLAQIDVENGTELLAGQLAIEIDRYDYGIQVAKKASYEKRFYNTINYPIIETPKIVNNKTMPKKELVLSVIRQESEFDTKANSSAGARGLMQLMTYTAKLVAKQAKLPYRKKGLQTDPDYNIKLGSFYLASLLEQYEGSYPFALAAYNAGPKRVKYWKKINSNPQAGKISYVDWIELIKFRETRNYVQRVLENINVYRYILNKNSKKMYNFFEDKPHF